MSLSLGAAAAIAFVVALVLVRLKAAPRVVPWLMLIAGLGVAGLLGRLLDKFAGVLETVVGAGTGALFGVAVPAALAVVCAVYLFFHLRPRGAKPTKLTVVTALVFPSVLASLGGAFAGLAVVASGFLGAVGDTLGSLFGDVMSGLGV
ncbi:hypothetical protein ABN034_12510 [Actinopolymorpha sp. B11F2]|uniref:hypothetical protein n=1 Tax=Actinopolymorpha sp. B11F2 TaxID=3160862 RepID=UPI0032E36ED4